jgi:hypothetical protein
MPMQFACPSCRRPLRMGDELLGTLVRCPGCNHEFVADASLRSEITSAPGEDRGVPPPPPPVDDPRIREGEPPARPAGGMPRYDDYEEDDADEQSRLRRRWDYEDELRAAREKVQRPAGNMIALGWICIVLSGLSIAAYIFVVGFGAGGVAFGPGGGARAPQFAVESGTRFVSSIIHLGLSILILMGGQSMKRMDNLGLAKAAAIIAMIPCVSPCCILGLPFGWSALQALNDPKVAAAFNRPRTTGTINDQMD